MPRFVKPLTANDVKNAKPAEKTKRLFDGRGLYLEISKVAKDGASNTAFRTERSESVSAPTPKSVWRKLGSAVKNHAG